MVLKTRKIGLHFSQKSGFNPNRCLNLLIQKNQKDDQAVVSLNPTYEGSLDAHSFSADLEAQIDQNGSVVDPSPWRNRNSSLNISQAGHLCLRCNMGRRFETCRGSIFNM